MTKIKAATRDLLGSAYTGAASDKITYAWQVSCPPSNFEQLLRRFYTRAQILTTALQGDIGCGLLETATVDYIWPQVSSQSLHTYNNHR